LVYGKNFPANTGGGDIEEMVNAQRETIELWMHAGEEALIVARGVAKSNSSFLSA